MCNHVPADDIALNLRIFRRRWPFLGYRLPRGRRLYLDGDAGDFVGALLEGGDVVVTGNAGNYAGIGMKTGTVQIGYSTGKYTGEGMRGGTLRVGGRIAALGRVKQGDIYEGDLQVFPVTNPEKPATVKPLTGTARHK
jgi:formylmethanofuran dehydrogenase subunit C